MEACLYESLENRRVRCRACSHYCVIPPGGRGKCGVRENKGGTLIALSYDRVIAGSVDPIEKKPLYHVKPGSRAYSIATPGCNFQCRFCQNADIAQMPRIQPDRIRGRSLSPEEMVAQAVAGHCQSMAYTYTEPTVFIELVRDTAQLARSLGLLNVLVTNGYMSPDLVEMAAPWVDAANVDLKSFDDEVYQTMCGARLAPVKKTLVRMKQAGIFVEVTTLVIPGMNDDPGELAAMADFIVQELGPDTPWHLSRFHPCHQLTDRGPTPARTLETACGIARQAGLYHVYTGNLPGSAHENTMCHACGTVLVGRQGYRTDNYMTDPGVCPACGVPVAGRY